MNIKNNRWLYSDASETPRVIHTKFPSSTKVLSIISKEGHFMLPQGLRVNVASNAVTSIQQSRHPIK